MISARLATVRTALICLLALAMLGLRAPVADSSGLAQVASVTSSHSGHSHEHPGHSHDEADEPSATSGHDHDRLHVGDHSHDTPAAAIASNFGFGSPRDQGPGTPDERIASRHIPPGDRPPREA